MRWTALFADLEAQWEQAHREGLDAEVADRSRRESALVGMRDRLCAAVGGHVSVSLGAGGAVEGRLVDAGPDWLLVAETGQWEVLVPFGGVVSVTGLTTWTEPVGSGGAVGARLDLRWALRGLARSRAGLRVVLRDGTRLAGTLDRVGSDHVELAEHALGEPRRARAVVAVRLLPLSALAALRQS